MKILFTILTFVFLTTTMLLGQCSDFATPNPNGKFFNMDYTMEANRDAALVGLESITYPAGPGCVCGDSITIAGADLLIQGPVGAEDRYRIRATSDTTGYYAGENGNFQGIVTFNYSDGTKVPCDYMTSSNSNLYRSIPVAIFPNPVQDQLTLINGEGDVTIYNALGHSVKELTVNTGQTIIPLNDVLGGYYILQVHRKDGSSVVKQFLKSN